LQYSSFPSFLRRGRGGEYDRAFEEAKQIGTKNYINTFRNNN
jgi:hypothetical protein